jgi:hypothetical protein
MESFRTNNTSSGAHGDEAVDKLDKLRADSLTMAGQLHSLHAAQLEKEAERIAKKYGPGHPRVGEIAASIASTKSMLATIQLQSSLLKSNESDFDASSWRVQGSVTVAGQPGTGLSVSLSINQEPRGQFNGTTDKQGFFSITLEKDAVEKLKQEKLFLTVADANGKLIYRDKNPIEPQAGIIDTVNVVA